MSSQDYRINAEVRRMLVSRWVDVSLLQIGTTNGVVYLMGSFEPLVEDALQRLGQVQERDPAQRLLRLLLLVDKELRRLRGVRDVVLNFRNVRRKGGVWRVHGSLGSVHVLDGDRSTPRRAEDGEAVVQSPRDEVREDEATTPTSGAE